MTATIIDGKAIAQAVRDEITMAVSARLAAGRSTPGLATVLVGENPASAMYVRMKQRACEQTGIKAFHIDLPADISQADLEKRIAELNADERVHGILVQLPLPGHLDEERILQAVALEKDVDGFHPINVGRLAQKGREPLFIPATPAGVLYLLGYLGVTLQGAHAVVLGRSNIVGLPVALLLIARNATVTVCHSRTVDLASHIRSADVLVTAVGQPEMVPGNWIKPGAVVIDVATIRVDDPTAEKGYVWKGDVNFAEALEVASAITPVPGGVGPMTIAMLLQNTLKAAELTD
jgi:5,10-methylene-tetrahydrofolate dehydrogenase/methenyl tetrahydrofolate cyclohydrolase